MKNLDKLNENATNRFEELKQQQLAKASRRNSELFTQQKAKEVNLPEELDDLKLPEKTMSKEEMQREGIDVIDIINMLELSPNLSLAVSFIVLSKQDKNNLKKAMEILEGEV